MPRRLTAQDFFAGSGLVSSGLSSRFSVIWANDISEEKAQTYVSNMGKEHFRLADIATVRGDELPPSDLSWASFPCQDISLAGLGKGIAGSRSGLVGEWLRLIDESVEKPKVLVAENVVGLIARRRGADFKTVCNAISSRGYRVGALILDAADWVPQSRKRVFIVAARCDMGIPSNLETRIPTWTTDGKMREAAQDISGWVWWDIPHPPKSLRELDSIVEPDAPFDSAEKTERLLNLISPRHMRILQASRRHVFPGYRRTRKGRQVLELRFDGLAGCLRTPNGGSSRQVLVFKEADDVYRSRLITAREAARLMGAPDSYRLPERYNQAYMAMGDAVCLPVVEYLSEHLLAPLAQAGTKAVA